MRQVVLTRLVRLVFAVSLLAIVCFFTLLILSAILGSQLNFSTFPFAAICGVGFVLLFISVLVAKRIPCPSCGKPAFSRKDMDAGEPDIVTPLTLSCVHCMHSLPY